MNECMLRVSVFRMKQAIIRNSYAVGMHHYGSRELSVGPVYYCQPETNIHDANAVAIYEDSACTKKFAYFKREDSYEVRQLFQLDFDHSSAYVRTRQMSSREMFTPNWTNAEYQYWLQG